MRAHREYTARLVATDPTGEAGRGVYNRYRCSAWLGMAVGQRDHERAEFSASVSQHLPALRRYAASLGLLTDAEDLVQEALERAWARRSTFDLERGPMLGWLLAIVGDRARRRWTRQRPTPGLDEREHIVDPPDPAQIDLRRAINALPNRQRTALVLYHYVDLSVEDIAVTMDCSVGTVKSTLYDARHSLALRLGDSYATS